VSEILVIIAAALVGYLISELAHSRKIIIASAGFFLAGAMTTAAVIGILVYMATLSWPA